MTRQDQIEQIKDAIIMSRRKIRLYEESMRGIPGIIRPDALRHDIEISQAVIDRLTCRLKTLYHDPI